MREHSSLYTSVPFVMFDVGGWVVVCCVVVCCVVLCCVVLCCVVLRVVCLVCVKKTKRQTGDAHTHLVMLLRSTCRCSCCCRRVFVAVVVVVAFVMSSFQVVFLWWSLPSRRLLVLLSWWLSLCRGRHDHNHNHDTQRHTENDNTNQPTNAHTTKATHSNITPLKQTWEFLKSPKKDENGFIWRLASVPLYAQTPCGADRTCRGCQTSSCVGPTGLRRPIPASNSARGRR